MSSRVLSIGVPAQERTRLCLAASDEVATQAAHFLQRAAQVSEDNAAAEPYVRAVYVYQPSAVVAERVSVASGEECGSYLRDVLRACAASVTGPRVACWLTVVLEDSCVLQHAVFAMTANSTKPQGWTSVLSLVPDSGSYQPGVMRWSQTSQPVLGHATPVGNVVTPPEPALAASASSTAPFDAAPPQPQEVTAAQPQERVSLAPVPAVARPTGTTPCAHSARTLGKAMAAVKGAPVCRDEEPQPQPQQDDAAQPVSRQQSPAPSGTAPSSAPPSGLYERVARYQVAGATPSVAGSMRSGHAPNGTVVYDSPQADLVVPSDGRQRGDLAYRTRYAPRREELWGIADAVMTHSHNGGEEPAYIEDYYDKDAE